MHLKLIEPLRELFKVRMGFYFVVVVVVLALAMLLSVLAALFLYLPLLCVTKLAQALDSATQ